MHRHHDYGAPAPAAPSAPNLIPRCDEASGCNAGDVLEHETEQRHSAASGGLMQASLTKEARNVQAVAAMRGVRVDPITSDDGTAAFVITWRTLSKVCLTLADVKALLSCMGVMA